MFRTTRAALPALLFAMFLVFTFGMQAEASAQSKWEVLTKEQGIVVSSREIKGYDLPQIRGVGTIKVGLFDVLAVLQDTEKHASWMHSCREARLLKRFSDYDLIVYNRTATPWPLDDRDAVVRSKVTVVPDKKTVMIHFNSISSPLQKPVDGVVRMPTLKGFYKLTYVDKDTTRITYQAQADPGGLIPDWFVVQGSKDIPLHTIASLRKRAMKTKGKYTDFLKRWDPEMGGQGFEGHPE